MPEGSLGPDFWLPSGVRASSADHDTQVHKALTLGRQGQVEDRGVRSEMAKNRRVAMQREGSSNVSFATMRPRDPMFYWEQNNAPWDIYKRDDLVKLRAYCRRLYLTHPVIAACIDIYSKYPLAGMELTCKDEEIKKFYETLFFDQLKWPRYSKSVGREYWTVGEAWPFGHFNDVLGVWEHDELLNPDDIEVIQSPFLKEPRFEMRLPKTMREVLERRQPEWEYKKLLEAYPALAYFTREDSRMPVSSVLLKQMKFEADTFHPRGLPILMRGFRSVLQEEMLNNAQDAVADRLSTPLLVAKLGASATDLGTQNPWIPTEDDIMEFEEALDIALAADFRVLTHHFALDLSSAWGKEVMPDFSTDFERLTERQLQVFGLSKTAIAGSAGGETYAGDALNRDYISQLLTDYQDLQKDLFQQRALVVAEAQEHFDYEERGGKRYPVMEEIYEVDADGVGRIVEQPKLLVPELKIKAMNMQDDVTFRQLIEALRAGGVPISMKTRLVNVPIDLEEEMETMEEEQIEQAIRAQKVRKQTYIRLKAEGLPIPDDLRQDFDPKVQQAQQNGTALQEGQQPNGQQQPGDPAIDLLGTTEPADTSGLAPTEGDYVNGKETSTADGAPGGNVVRLPRTRMRPSESDEQRSGMPRGAAREDVTEYPAAIPADPRTYLSPEALASIAQEGKGDKTQDIFTALKASPMVNGPGHIGMRRHAKVRKDEPLPDDTRAG